MEGMTMRGKDLNCCQKESFSFERIESVILVIVRERGSEYEDGCEEAAEGCMRTTAKARPTILCCTGRMQTHASKVHDYMMLPSGLKEAARDAQPMILCVVLEVSHVRLFFFELTLFD